MPSWGCFSCFPLTALLPFPLSRVISAAYSCGIYVRSRLSGAVDPLPEATTVRDIQLGGWQGLYVAHQIRLSTLM